MILRSSLICIGVLAAALGCVFQFSTFASAQSTTPPVVVVATIPPQPTPLPRLVLPREEFAETDTAASDGSNMQSPAPGSPQAAQLALASYGVVTVSIDDHNPTNSAALIATPHGVVMARVNDLVDGYRLTAVNASGVTFAGGVVIPVGYSQQGSNPSVPPVGPSLPMQRVPVTFTAPSPTPLPAPSPVVRPLWKRVPPKGMPQITPFQTPPTPGLMNSQQPLRSPSIVNPNNPMPGGSPQP